MTMETRKEYSEISDELNVTYSQIHKNIKKAYTKIRSDMDKTLHVPTDLLFFYLLIDFYMMQ